MRVSFSELLEMVDRCLPRSRYRVHGTTDGRGFFVHVDSVDRAHHMEFPIARDELATDARAEWSAIMIARKVKAAAPPAAPRVPGP